MNNNFHIRKVAVLGKGVMGTQCRRKNKPGELGVYCENPGWYFYYRSRNPHKASQAFQGYTGFSNRSASLTVCVQ